MRKNHIIKVEYKLLFCINYFSLFSMENRVRNSRTDLISKLILVGKKAENLDPHDIMWAIANWELRS